MDRSWRITSYTVQEMVETIQNDSDSGEDFATDDDRDPMYDIGSDIDEQIDIGDSPSMSTSVRLTDSGFDSDSEIVPNPQSQTASRNVCRVGKLEKLGTCYSVRTARSSSKGVCGVYLWCTVQSWMDIYLAPV